MTSTHSVRAYAGIAWDEEGYGVAILGDGGRPIVPSRRFAPGETEALICDLREFDDQLVAIVDSTNGILDGRLMAAGVTVYRADPPVLPERPLFGSVCASALATVGYRASETLTRLERARGSQTGRELEFERTIAASLSWVAAATARGSCASHGTRDAPQVALTFDDGPLAPYTDHVLDILERYEVTGTFFCVGMNAEAGAEELLRMREAGHTIGNHTWSHPFLSELTLPQLAEQVEQSGRALAAASGGSMPTAFRPPHGLCTPNVLEWLTDLIDLTVFWDVTPDDWAMPGAETIALRVLKAAQPGSIILLHDGGGDRSQTVRALPTIVEGLLERGYDFVSVHDLAPAASTTQSSRLR